MKMKIKNPLGLFALLITTMYAVTALAFREGLSPLCGVGERLPVIAFVVVFPFVLLLTVYRLVVKYPGHLFSPGEFKTVEDYLCATHNELYLRKVEAEVAALNASVAMPGGASTAGAPAAGAQRVGNAGRVAGEAGATQPGTDRPEADGVRGEGAMTLAAYRGIEARAVDEMERIYGISFVRGAVLNIGKRRVVVDAVGHRGDVSYIVEVKYWRNGRDAAQLCEGLHHFLSQRRLFRRIGEVRMVVAVVLDRPEPSLQREVEVFVARRTADACLHFIYLG